MARPRALEDGPPVFPAKYPGACRHCGEDFRRGALIAYIDRATYIAEHHAAILRTLRRKGVRR